MYARTRRLVGYALRVALSLLAVALLLARVDRAALGDSFARLSPLVLVGCAAVIWLGLLVAVVRFRVLLRACGALRLPGYARTMRQYLIALFYNLLPGGLGGDLLRGYEARDAFDSASGAIAVVLLERICGVAGLMLLAGGSALLTRERDPWLLAFSGLGLLAVAGAVLAFAVGRRFAEARWLPTFARRHLRELPALRSFPLLALSIALSMLTHLMSALAGHLVIASLTTKATLLGSLIVFPLSVLATYVPLSIAGAGARDTALVLLFARFGIERADALATSLSLLAVTLAFAALGGLLQWTRA